MYKIILLSLISLIFISCSNTQGPSVSSKRFQSVSADEVIILQDTKDKNSCSICGMNLRKFYKTNHAADYKTHIKQYCSLHCMVSDLNRGHTLKNPKVVDVNSLKFIDASRAYYVVGSSKPATMSHISKYAFKNEKDAKEFAKLYGGEIKDMYKAIDTAQKDFR
jgi:nitrous oxide reductase accessory protein NosL